MISSTKKNYYNVEYDIRLYPAAWLYVAYSARGSGKTYSFFRYCIENELPFLYLKRTQIDIDLLSREDFSPFKPLMRDYGWNIKTEKLYEGILRILKDGEVIGYCMAMSAVHKYKGFDLSEVRYMCLDEFIPQLTERVNRKEGELLLDLYMTVSRDREARGEDPLKLCLFANATELYCPITETLGIVDALAGLNATGADYIYLDERRIMLHHIIGSVSAGEDTAIFAGMKGTQWADMAFGGTFSYNDFSKVRRIPLAGYVPYVRVRYQRKDLYIYQHKSNGHFYMTDSKGRTVYQYDLEIESDQSAFYQDWVWQLQQELIEGNMAFKTYSMYNLIRNYKKIFKGV